MRWTAPLSGKAVQCIGSVNGMFNGMFNGKFDGKFANG
jgi:hypothetical protein